MRDKRVLKSALSAALLAAIALSPQAMAATQLIQNGGFEADGMETTMPLNWQTFADGIIGSVTTATGPVSPISGYATAGPYAGSYYGLLDAAFPSNNALIQTFSTVGAVTSAVLTFRLFVNDQNPLGASVNNTGLDYTTGGSFAPNQHTRVDLLRGGASPFDTGAGVVRSMYLQGDGGISSPNPYQKFTFDLTQDLAAGGTFQLRFANVANQAALQTGVDNVSLLVAAVPEPSTYALMFAGLGLIGTVVRRRRNQRD